MMKFVRFLRILLALMVLAACVTPMAAAQEALEIRLQEEPVLEHTVYIGAGSSMDFGRMWIDYSQYSDLYNLYGYEPKLTVTVVEGNEDLIYYSGSGAYMDIGLDRCGDIPGDTLVDVTCRWGEYTLSRRLTIHTVQMPAEFPNLVVSPAVTIRQGENVTLKPTDLYAPFGQIKGEFSFYTYTEALGEGEAEVSWSYPEGLMVTADTAGVYKIIYHYRCANIVQDGEFYLKVADESGRVPEPQPILSFDAEEDTFYLGMDSVGSTYSAGVRFELGFENAGLIQKYYGVDYPEWTMRTVKGENGLFGLSVAISGDGVSGNPSATAELNKVPSAPGDIQIEISTTWLGKAYSKIFTLHAVNPPMGAPTGLDLPDEILVEKGKHVQIDVAGSVLPKGWTLEGEEVACGWLISGSFWDYADLEEEDGIYTITGLEYGATRMTLEWECANYVFKKNVKVKVVDENGQIPEVEPELSVDMERSFVGLEDRVIFDPWEPYSQSVVFSVKVEKLSTLKELTDGIGEWTITPLKGDDSFMNYKRTQGSLMAYLGKKPEQVGIVELLITYTIDEYSVSTTVTIPVQEGAYMPYALDYPEKVTLKVGESFTFGINSVLPESWVAPNASVSRGGYNGSAELEMYSDDDSLYDYRYDKDGNIVITALKPGVTYLNFDWSYSYENYIYAEVLLEVCDENGQYPLPKFEVYTNSIYDEELPYYLGGDSSLGWYYIPASVGMAYSQKYGCDPVWKVEPIGCELDIELKGNAYDGEVVINTPITKEGTYTYRLTCTMGEYEQSEEFTFPVKTHRLGTPTGLDLPNRIVVKKGEPFYISPDVITPDTFDGDYWDFYLDDAPQAFYDAYEVDILDDGSWEWRVYVTGVFPITLCWSYDDFWIYGDVIIDVRDELLPAEAAFAQSSAVLPVGLRAIPFPMIGDVDRIEAVEWTSDGGVVGRDGIADCEAEGTYAVSAEVTFDDGTTKTLSGELTVRAMPTITLPAHVRTVDEEAFASGASGRVVLPDGAKTIGKRAFAGCAGLYLIDIPQSVTQIADDALDGAVQAAILCAPGSAAETFAEEAGIDWYHFAQ